MSHEYLKAEKNKKRWTDLTPESIVMYPFCVTNSIRAPALIVTLLVQCWANVPDAGPALNQQWVQVDIHPPCKYLLHLSKTSNRRCADVVPASRQLGADWYSCDVINPLKQTELKLEELHFKNRIIISWNETLIANNSSSSFKTYAILFI